MQLYSRLTSTVLKRLHAGQYDKESLDLAAKLLEQNPEVYTVWNHRKRALLLTLSTGGNAAAEAVKTELALTQRALQKHPKSYATWHHRRWLVAQHVTSLQQEVDLVNRSVDACDGPSVCRNNPTLSAVCIASACAVGNDSLLSSVAEFAQSQYSGQPGSASLQRNCRMLVTVPGSRSQLISWLNLENGLLISVMACSISQADVLFKQEHQYGEVCLGRCCTCRERPI